MLADEIAKLAELRDRGVLTADEFNRQKAKLLDSDSLSSGGATQPSSTIPQHVLEHLKKSSVFHNVECYECGYHGRMGETGKSYRWWGSWWFLGSVGFAAFVFGLAFGLSYWTIFFISFFIFFTRDRAKDVYLSCPNCKKALKKL